MITAYAMKQGTPVPGSHCSVLAQLCDDCLEQMIQMMTKLGRMAKLGYKSSNMTAIQAKKVCQLFMNGNILAGT